MRWTRAPDSGTGCLTIILRPERYAERNDWLFREPAGDVICLYPMMQWSGENFVAPGDPCKKIPQIVLQMWQNASFSARTERVPLELHDIFTRADAVDKRFLLQIRFNFSPLLQPKRYEKQRKQLFWKPGRALMPFCPSRHPIDVILRRTGGVLYEIRLL